MPNFRLEDMIGGWFVGKFSPSVLSTDACEVAVKTYCKGDKEREHTHKIATEATVVISGKIKMLGQVWGAGDIVVVEPNVATAFEALEDTVSVVVKVPGALNDKYLRED